MRGPTGVLEGVPGGPQLGGPNGSVTLRVYKWNQMDPYRVHLVPYYPSFSWGAPWNSLKDPTLRTNDIQGLGIKYLKPKEISGLAWPSTLACDLHGELLRYAFYFPLIYLSGFGFKYL